MEERRKWKNVNVEHGRATYGKLNNELRRETDRARAKLWENQCSELEELERRWRSDLLYAKVKELCLGDRSSKKQESVLNKDGKLLTDTEEVKERWKEHMEDVHAN